MSLDNKIWLLAQRRKKDRRLNRAHAVVNIGHRLLEVTSDKIRRGKKDCINTLLRMMNDKAMHNKNECSVPTSTINKMHANFQIGNLGCSKAR